MKVEISYESARLIIDLLPTKTNVPVLSIEAMKAVLELMQATVAEQERRGAEEAEVDNG